MKIKYLVLAGLLIIVLISLSPYQLLVIINVIFILVIVTVILIIKDISSQRAKQAEKEIGAYMASLVQEQKK